MSLHEFIHSQVLAERDVPFHALIMAAMRKADTGNIEKLKSCWPETWDELEKRYWSPGGLLPGERVPVALLVCEHDKPLAECATCATYEDGAAEAAIERAHARWLEEVKRSIR